mmetsp:Transcript_9456/g.11341  ORF Transcript_9456/g.11341 Transcript_9456/m.11341 type:complete len:224 (+) Transcript_9456:2-673(+)
MSSEDDNDDDLPQSLSQQAMKPPTSQINVLQLAEDFCDRQPLMPHGYNVIVLLEDAEMAPESEIIHYIKAWHQKDPGNEIVVRRLVSICLEDGHEEFTLKSSEMDSHFEQKQKMMTVLSGLIDTVEQLRYDECPSWKNIVAKKGDVRINPFVVFVWKSLAAIAKLNDASDTNRILCSTFRQKLWRARFFNVRKINKVEAIMGETNPYLGKMLKYQLSLFNIME